MMVKCQFRFVWSFLLNIGLLGQEWPTFSGSGLNFGKIGRMRATDHGNSAVRQRKCGKEQKNVFTARTRLKSKKSLPGPDAFEERKKKKIFTARTRLKSKKSLHGPDVFEERKKKSSRLGRVT